MKLIGEGPIVVKRLSLSFVAHVWLPVHLAGSLKVKMCYVTIAGAPLTLLVCSAVLTVKDL